MLDSRVQPRLTPNHCMLCSINIFHAVSFSHKFLPSIQFLFYDSLPFSSYPPFLSSHPSLTFILLPAIPDDLRYFSLQAASISSTPIHLVLTIPTAPPPTLYTWSCPEADHSALTGHVRLALTTASSRQSFIDLQTGSFSLSLTLTDFEMTQCRHRAQGCGGQRDK